MVTGGVCSAVKFQVFDRFSVIDKFFERIDADAEVFFHVFAGDSLIAGNGLNPCGDHGLIGNKQ